MRHIDILLPFGLPAPEFARDLLRELRAPSLATLLARASPPVRHAYDPFARSLPHEAWLAAQLGLNAGSDTDTSPALAVSRMRSLGLSAAEGVWFALQPVHIHIARDQLMLADSRTIPLSESESRALFDTALPLFQYAGKELLYGDASNWFVRADDWRALQTATPDAASGRNLDIWMPKGEGERDWRKLQNEVHLEWHEHPVNATRAEQRLPPVNSLWLWGPAEAANKYSAAIAPQVATNGYTLGSHLTNPPNPSILVLDHLSEAALAEDWGSWLAGMQMLEQDWFAPLLEALRGGRIDTVRLALGHNAQVREFSISKRALLKFWSKPSLARLAP